MWTVLIALIFVAAPVGAQCPAPEILDRSLAPLLGGAGLALIAGGGTPRPDRAAHAREVLARAPTPAVCPDAARLIFDGPASRVEHRYGSRWFGERIPATLWPSPPRERWVMRNGRYVNEAPAPPTAAQIEERWLGAYVAAVARIGTPAQRR